jgi:hypothetical protein
MAQTSRSSISESRLTPARWSPNARDSRAGRLRESSAWRLTVHGPADAPEGPLNASGGGLTVSIPNAERAPPITRKRKHRSTGMTVGRASFGPAL